jgi:hypothetical protein
LEFEARQFVETARSAETMAQFHGLLLGLERKPDSAQEEREELALVI